MGGIPKEQLQAAATRKEITYDALPYPGIRKLGFRMGQIRRYLAATRRRATQLYGIASVLGSNDSRAHVLSLKSNELLCNHRFLGANQCSFSSTNKTFRGNIILRPESPRLYDFFSQHFEATQNQRACFTPCFTWISIL
jgi:hypothetical protein